MRKTTAMRLLEYERGKSLVEIIEELAERGFNHRQIAAEIGVSVQTLYEWCSLLGLKLVSRYRVERIDEPAGVR